MIDLTESTAVNICGAFNKYVKTTKSRRICVFYSHILLTKSFYINC
jgi:hypothetical protein